MVVLLCLLCCRGWMFNFALTQVLNNLLGNAAKFTHQGFIRVSASWHDQQQQWVAVHVTDTGIGIPKQKLSSIFLPFEQVDGSISRQYGGFGLGLSITQELVKAHGGEIWVKSKEGKGSCFTFTLPSYTGQTKSAQQPRVQATVSITRGASLKQEPSDWVPALSRYGSRADLAELSGGRRSRRGSMLACAGSAAAAAADFISGGRSRRGSMLASAGSAAAGDAARDGKGLPLDSPDFADSCVGEEYAAELPYDAAQLAALASSKPFTATSGSSVQRLQNGRQASRAAAGAAAQAPSSSGAGEAAAAPPVRLDPRPTQFARTGRYQILSVDDDFLNQTVVQSLLSSTGYEVLCLPSGVKALEYIDTCEVLPDLILLDVMMPDMSG